MDSLITAAARALAAGDPIGALKRVALRDDAPALALRGIAMAQLGEHGKARVLLRRAARAFGPKEALARARCVVAEAEVALASRDLGWAAKALDAARRTLDAHGDRINAAHARYLEVRHLVLVGRLEEAEGMLAAVDPGPVPPALRAAHELLLAGIAMRRIRTGPARVALARAGEAARRSGIPALAAEVESALLTLDAPAARLISRGEERPLRLEEVEALLASNSFVVDACRHSVRQERKVVSLAKRPVLFALARALGEAWPGDVARDALVARVFRLRVADESHRARLRVEMARLRAVLRPLAEIKATARGFALSPRGFAPSPGGFAPSPGGFTPPPGGFAPPPGGSAPSPGGFATSPGGAPEVIVLARPMEEKHADVLAFLADGESWSTSALALALRTSQRTVQRALDALALAGKVQSFGRGRARRWLIPPVAGFATSLLLPPPLPVD